jgi:hypothetical protein
MLKAAGLVTKPSYTSSEVQLILQISPRTFWYMTSAYEPDPEKAQPKSSASLDSYMLRRTKRVRYDELVDYLARNNTYERKHAIDPRQMDMFG